METQTKRNCTSAMTSRKRSGSGSSKRPKEKVVYIYELFFRGEDPTSDSPEFWNEFFLLQPNVESLESEITKITSEQLPIVKSNLNLIFQKCIEILETGNYWGNKGVVGGIYSIFRDMLTFYVSADHPKRLCNSLQTLCSLFYAIFKKSSADATFDILNEIFGYEQMDKWMKQLMEHCSQLLLGMLFFLTHKPVV